MHILESIYFKNAGTVFLALWLLWKIFPLLFLPSPVLTDRYSSHRVQFAHYLLQPSKTWSRVSVSWVMQNMYCIALHCSPFYWRKIFCFVITVLVLSKIIAFHTSSIHTYLRNQRNQGFFYDTGLEYLNQTWRALHKIAQTVYYILLAINCGKDWSILMYYWENSRLEKQVDGSEHICKWVRCVLKGTFPYISFEPLSIQERYLNSHFLQMKA